MLLRAFGTRSLRLLACLVLVSLGVQAQSRDLEAEKAQAVQQQQALRKQLEALQARLARTRQEQVRVADALQKSEEAISLTVRSLQELEVERKQQEADLVQTQAQIKAVNARAAEQSAALARQLRAQYSSGLSEWSALLSGEDPQALGRDLGYLEFVSRSRTETIEALRRSKEELSDLHAAQTAQKVAILQTEEQTLQRREALVQERVERQRVLAQIEKQLEQERSQASKLSADQEALATLIQGLSVEIDRWRQEQAQAQSLKATQAAQAARVRQEQQARESQEAREAREAALASLPQGQGIKRGLSRPVKGRTLARFGSKRPEGGSWRGVLLDAQEGEPVTAVAPGTVVFSKWVSGFGNLLIIDHGDDFLTVYAYNQSLLKDPGDVVRSGDIVANAGNTGGQLESALYFELRHRGSPLDPMLYFKSQ